MAASINPVLPASISHKNEIFTIGKVAAHVPDLIVYGDLSQKVPSTEKFDGVLMFIDISGFTALAETFSTSTSLDYGADQLTQTLNRYVGDIVEEVMNFGGDILKFAGDALLALWKVKRCHMKDIITLVLKCSLRIQQEYGEHETDVGQTLRVKIGLSAGHISKIIVGDNRHQYFLVIGRAVEEVRVAQNLAQAGEIILSSNCWGLCHRKVIIVEKIAEERAVKLKYIVDDPTVDQGDFYERCTEYLADNHISESPEILRSASVLSPNEELEKGLRKLVMRNVLKKENGFNRMGLYPLTQSSQDRRLKRDYPVFQIDDNQPLEYLSELRPVTIVFVNLQFPENATIEDLTNAIQGTHTFITTILYPFRGKVNKIFMFDKGCTFLCIFGLPGDKQENESSQALECAYKIHNFCSETLKKRIKIVSVGVTSGPVFCGVMGHEFRHEYTVVGRKVNLAARIMMTYTGMVTCDEVTCTESKLPYYSFEEVHAKEMKGIVNPGKIYSFLGVTEKRTVGKAYLTRQRSEDYPLLGRESELDLFENSLDNFKGSKKSHIMLFEGHHGYGKSQLMAEITYLGQSPGQKVVATELGKINMSQNLFTVQTLVAMVLGIDTCKTADARQRTLLHKLSGIAEDSYFCLLNRLFRVKFPSSKVVAEMNDEKRIVEMQKILVKILQKVAEKDILIFIIDDAQFIDHASWDFLDHLLEVIHIFVVMSLSPLEFTGQILCSSATRLLSGAIPNTYVRLRELTPAVIVQKACQDLGVISIARELETFLIQRSRGNPFYCEELLRSLKMSNSLEFYILEEEEESEDEWDSLFTTKSLKAHASKVPENSEVLYICSIRQNVKLNNIMLPPTLKGIALSKIDNMNPSEQMVVKCAAVIGMTFSTYLLFYILPNWTKTKMNQTLAALVEANIFECFAEGKASLSRPTRDIFAHELGNFPKKTTIKKEQDSDLGLVIASNIKKEEEVRRCAYMSFCTPLVQEAAYELWLKSQKRKLHLKCASYLESDAQKCKCCGQGEFVAFHHYALDGVQWRLDLQELKREPERDILSEAASVIVSQTLLCFDESEQKDSEEEAAPHRSNLSQLIPPDMDRKSSTGQTSLASFCKKYPSFSLEPGKSDQDMYSRRQSSLKDPFSVEEEEKEFLIRMDLIICLLECGVRTMKARSSCKCEQTVESVIVPLSHHSLAVEHNIRAFYYFLESAAAYIHLSNNYIAFTYLNTAETLFKCLDPKRKIISQFEKSVFYSLKGEVCYNMGQLNLAKQLVKKALQYVKKSFPLTIVGAFFMSLAESTKHKSHQKKEQTCGQTTISREKRLAVLYQQCRCLSLLWQIFSLDTSTNSQKFAHLAALMMLNCAEEARDECQIITSYMEFSLCCQLIGHQEEWMKYEKIAIKRSLHLRIVGGELHTIAKVVVSLAYMKLCLGNLPLAIQLGHRAHQMCVQMKKFKLDYSALSDLFTALLLSIRYKESVEVLSWLEDLSLRDGNVIGKAYFVSGCLDLLLYAGFSYKPFNYCLEFILANKTNCILMSQSGIMLGLYSSAAIWFARLRLWEEFNEIFEQARRLARRTSTSLLANYGFCKFVECEALLLQKCIGEKPDKVYEIRSKASKNLEQALSQCSTSPVYYPRVYLLKAYVQLMIGDDEESVTSLRMAFQTCNENKLERSWLDLTEKWWFTGTDPMEDWWLQSAPDFPVWEVGTSAEDLGPFERNKYLLKMPELNVENPFPEPDEQTT